MAKLGPYYNYNRGENQKKGKRDREALSVGIAGAKASAIRPIAAVLLS